MNWVLWLNLLSTFGTAVAQANGKDERAIRYLRAATDLVYVGVATDDDLAALKAKYEEEVRNDTPTTASELDAIQARIRARSEAIQSP